MSIRRLFRNQSIHFDFQEKRALERGDDFPANAIVEEIFEQRGRFEISILGWLGCVSMLVAKAILFEEHKLLFSGPAQRVAVQATGQRERKLSSEQSCGCRCCEFEKQQKGLLGNILSGEFLKPSTDFAIGSVDGRHEGEHQNRLAHLGIANISPRLDDCAEHFT